MTNSSRDQRTQGRLQVLGLLIGLAVSLASGSVARAEGEPAAAFIKQLRNAGYFDTAITYLDRVSQIPGVDPSFLKAIPLEKAQTFIDAALNSRNNDDRDEMFANAETALQKFLGAGEHPRASEARLQLGKLQMIRASQLLSGEPDQSKKDRARQSYLAASKTFDDIVNTLRAKLQEMRGQNLDPGENPEEVKLRDQYRFEFLQSQLNAAEAIKLAAKTLDDPKAKAKGELEDVIKRLTDLNKKYKNYGPGAIALMHLGQAAEMLGNNEAALTHYLNMLEQPEADQLRDAKFLAAAGFARLKLESDPPKYKEAIDRTAPWVKEIRPNEKNLASVQEFRIELAKAYLAKSKDESIKRGESGRALSEGRQLLQAASKSPGPHVEEVNAMLADLGIEKETNELPTAEPPKSFDDAMEKAREILEVVGQLENALELLAKQNDDAVEEQKKDIRDQIVESYVIGAQVLQAGLVMINSETNAESVNQARQILTYFLYQQQRHRETIVVGSFLARAAPGSDVGLKGGLMALTAMQLLLAEVPDDENAGLIRQLESLGDYLAQTWPDDPQAAEAQGMRIRLLLKKDDFDGAQALIDEMAEGNEKAFFQRLLGQLFWNQSIMIREEDEAKSKLLVEKAIASLTAGLEGIEGNLVDAEGMKAALVLARAHLLSKNSSKVLEVLDHPKYGPIGLMERIAPPSESFAGDLYSVELKALVGEMLAGDDPGQFLDRMTKTMEKLRDAYSGEAAKEKLTGIYVRLARDLREQLDGAPPAKKVKLIDAFREMLGRISDATDDQATLSWVGQTLMSMGESLMEAGQCKANGQALDLIAQAAGVFKGLNLNEDITTAYLLGRAQRLSGDYKGAIDTLEEVLKKKPMMLDAQFEGAQANECWAGQLPPNIAYNAYKAALLGSRPKEGKNTIWGWAEISKKTNRNPNFRDKFFESRYHVSLVLYLMGKVKKRDADIKKAIKDIKQISTLFPKMGGPAQRAKYDALLKQAQKEVGDQVTGLPPLPANNANGNNANGN